MEWFLLMSQLFWLNRGDPDQQPAGRLTLVSRQISQHAGTWLISYQLRYDGGAVLVLSPSEVTVRYSGTVSNSRSKPHTIARSSQAQFSLAEGPSTFSTVIESHDERQRCRERISIAIQGDSATAVIGPSAQFESVPILLRPGQTARLTVQLEHDHFLYGAYDPLLGNRELDIQFGSNRILDSILFDTEHAPERPQVTLSAPPRERLDSRQYHSAPTSLFLTVHEPGYQYFRFDDVPVPYHSEWTISFWYLVAQGTDGKCHARVTEFQDAPTAWYRLQGGFDETMAVQGNWTKFEQTFRTQGTTTTIVIDFRIVDASLGEWWIDDVQIRPVIRP